MAVLLNVLLMLLASVASAPVPVGQEAPTVGPAPAERAHERPRCCMTSCIELPPPPKEKQKS
ncbi:MAG: hypothetical protein R3E76_16095 [Planctomycetota bacterium]